MFADAGLQARHAFAADVMHYAEQAKLLCDRLHVACFAAEVIVTVGHYLILSSLLGRCHVRDMPLAAQVHMHGHCNCQFVAGLP